MQLKTKNATLQPIAIRIKNCVIIQDKLTDFDKKSVSFHFQLAAELHRAGIFDMIQPEQSDWRLL